MTENRFRIHPEVEVYLTDLAFVADDGRRFAAAMGCVWQRVPALTRSVLFTRWRNACGPLIEYGDDWAYRHWYDLACTTHGGHVMHFFAPALRVSPAVVTEAVIAHQLARAVQATAGSHFPRNAGYRPGGLTEADTDGEIAAWGMVASWGLGRGPLEEWLRTNEEFLGSLRRDLPSSEPLVA